MDIKDAGLAENLPQRSLEFAEDRVTTTSPVTRSGYQEHTNGEHKAFMEKVSPET
jgi:hypothetical protein